MVKKAYETPALGELCSEAILTETVSLSDGKDNTREALKAYESYAGDNAETSFDWNW